MYTSVVVLDEFLNGILFLHLPSLIFIFLLR